MANPVTSRGVLYPGRLPAFHREAAPHHAEMAVAWFWIPEWDVDPGRTVRQHLIGFLACNLVVEETITGISGPTTRASYRDLTGTGWAVGALLRPAAVPALVDDVASLRDSYQGVEFPDLASAVRASMTADAPSRQRHEAAIGAFTDWLLNRIGTPREEALLANRMVDAAATDSSLLTVPDLAAELNLSTRTLQRLAAKYVGVSPAALIRRRRLQEAVEQLRQDPGLDLTALAHQFGYADHAHLTNDFRRALGFTPTAYRGMLPAE